MQIDTSVGVGVVGSSKGGDLALSCAHQISQVKACVINNSCLSSLMLETHYKNNKVIEALPFDIGKIVVSHL